MLAVTQQGKRPHVPDQYEAAQVRHTQGSVMSRVTREWQATGTPPNG